MTKENYMQAAKQISESGLSEQDKQIVIKQFCRFFTDDSYQFNHHKFMMYIRRMEEKALDKEKII